MKFIKQLLAIVLMLSMITITDLKVKAAGVDISANKEIVEVGESVTITASFTGAAWSVSVSGKGISGASYASQTDDLSETTNTKTFTLDTSVADTYTITISGDVTDANGVTTQVSDSVTVTVKAPQTGNPDDGNTGDTGNEGDTGNDGNTGDTGNDGNTGDTGNDGNTGDTGNDGNTGTTTPDPDPEPEKKSDDARLYSLTIKDGKGNKVSLSPSFKSTVMDYTVELTSEVTEIKITAEAWDDNAEVEGDGTKPIKIGSNSFTIDVTAEDGKTKKSYTVNVDVKEVPVTYLEFNGEQYGIMKEVENADIPKGFTTSSATINQINVPVFENADKSITLIYALSPNETKGFYLYTEDNGILGLYSPILINGNEIYLIDIPEDIQTREGMKFSTITINNTEVKAWVFDDEELIDYSVLYVVNREGIIGYYLYNAISQTIVDYPKTNPTTYDEFVEAGLIQVEEPVNYALYGGIAAGVITILSIIIFFIFKKRKSRVEEIEANEDKLVFENFEATKEFVFDRDVEPIKEEPIQEIHEIETDLEKIKLEDEEDMILPSIIVSEDDSDDDWLSDDFYKTILGEDDE